MSLVSRLIRACVHQCAFFCYQFVARVPCTVIFLSSDRDIFCPMFGSRKTSVNVYILENVLIFFSVFFLSLSCSSSSDVDAAHVEKAPQLKRSSFFLLLSFFNLLPSSCLGVLYTGLSSSLILHLAWLKSKMKHCASSKFVQTIAQHVAHYTFDEWHTSTWHLQSFLHTDTTTSTCSHFLSSETELCHDPQQVSIGYLADPTNFTGYKPKDLSENEDLRVKPLLFHRPSLTSTYDAAESIATLPPESDLDDDQIRTMLASPLYLQERERGKCRPTTSFSLCKIKF